MLTNVWRLWWLLSLIACGVHLAMLSTDSRINQDEVQIVDLGRSVLQPDKAWAVSWDIQLQAPVLPVSYLGPVIQEIAFRASFPNDVGIRISSLLGGLLAATCALGWLLARGTPAAAALVLALAFLLDPAFSITYRDGRVDGWAMACCLATCWLLRYAMCSDSVSKVQMHTIYFAGATAATSLFIWPSSLMLTPLIALEFLLLLHSRTHWNLINLHTLGWPVIKLMVYGGISAAAVWSIPIILNWEIYLAGLRTTFALQTWASIFQSSLFDLIAAHDPIIVLVAIISLVFKRDWGLLLAFGAAAAMASQTMLYPARLIYFLPYLLAIIGGAAAVSWQASNLRLGKAVLTRALVLLLAWNSVLVLIIRPVILWHQHPVADPDEIISALEQTVGTGDYRVLLAEWQPYFAGRALGWQMLNGVNPVSVEVYEQFLMTMDFVIVAENPLYQSLSDWMREDDNFKLIDRLAFAESKTRVLDFKIFTLTVPSRGYKTILVYRKVNALIAR